MIVSARKSLSRSDCFAAWKIFKPQNLDALAYALHWYEGGMDFGDALHLAMSAKETGFKTFDKAFVKVAKNVSAYPDVSAP